MPIKEILLDWVHVLMKYSIASNRLILLRPVQPMFPISSHLGYREIGDMKQFHPGIDFACPIGSPVRAIVDGHIFRAGYENSENHKQGFGLRIWQEAKIGSDYFYIWYGHLSELLSIEGEVIERGQVIGFSGNTGYVLPEPTEENPRLGSHLHVQIRKKDTNTLYDVDWMEA